jgi:hypothetical protein
MSEESPHPVPSRLKAPGRRLWAAVTAEYVLTPGEYALLVEACRTADELDRLQRAIRALDDLMIEGSMGQMRQHPLLAEARSHRLVLERLTAAMALPGLDQVMGLSPAQKHGQKAAEGRWGKPMGVEHGPTPNLAG